MKRFFCDGCGGDVTGDIKREHMLCINIRRECGADGLMKSFHVCVECEPFVDAVARKLVTPSRWREK